MPRTYPPEYKAGVLERLRAYQGDITLVSRLTGVPERTLRAWRREIWLDLLPPLPPMPPPPPPSERQSASELPKFDDFFQAMKFLREKMINELVSLAVSLSDSPGLMTPYQRLQLIMQLMNRIIGLHEYLDTNTVDPEAVFRWVAPRDDDTSEEADLSDSLEGEEVE
jgi:hypothetical protein